MADSLDEGHVRNGECGKAEKAAGNLRPDSDGLLDGVKQELLHALRKETGPSERRVLRLYGFKYTPSPGETPEPEPIPVVPA